MHFTCWTGGQLCPSSKEEIWSITCVVEEQRRGTGLCISGSQNKSVTVKSWMFRWSNILHLTYRVKLNIFDSDLICWLIWNFILFFLIIYKQPSLFITIQLFYAHIDTTTPFFFCLFFCFFFFFLFFFFLMISYTWSYCNHYTKMYNACKHQCWQKLHFFRHGWIAFCKIKLQH